jgi:hypothetical protein
MEMPFLLLSSSVASFFFFFFFFFFIHSLDSHCLSLVTPQTSMLVLDSLDQYLKYEVEPPNSLPYHAGTSLRSFCEGSLLIDIALFNFVFCFIMFSFSIYDQCFILFLCSFCFSRLTIRSIENFFPHFCRVSPKSSKAQVC